MARGGTVTPNGEAIKRLRVEKGWDLTALAGKAGYSRPTIRDAEKSKPCFPFTLKGIADALGVEVAAILAGDPEPPQPAIQQAKAVRVNVTIEIPFDQFSQCEQLLAFIERLKGLMPARGELEVAGVAEGSTVITLEMSPGDYHRLMAAFEDGLLEGLGVTDVVEAPNTPRDDSPGQTQPGLPQSDAELTWERWYAAFNPRLLAGLKALGIPDADAHVLSIEAWNAVIMSYVEPASAPDTLLGDLAKATRKVAKQYHTSRSHQAHSHTDTSSSQDYTAMPTMPSNIDLPYAPGAPIERLPSELRAIILSRVRNREATKHADDAYHLRQHNIAKNKSPRKKRDL